MTENIRIDLHKYVSAIQQSGLSIYHPIAVGHPTLWIPTPQLQTILDEGLRGLVLAGFPIRTRSKVVKEQICRILGYPIPSSFQKTQPRFPGQMFDTYTQKSNNLQIWNEELSPIRRYVLIRVSNSDIVTRVKVVTGDTLALIDTTGTLTRKFQARCIPTDVPTELVTREDTGSIMRLTNPSANLRYVEKPTNHPKAGELLPIATIYERLSKLIGVSFTDAGSDQERNRGAALHQLVCTALGYTTYQDDGRFPDVPHQLVEVKLQTSQTIDLGLVLPGSLEPLDVPMIEGVQIRHSDVRYAIFYASITNRVVTLSHLILTTGEAFFTRFAQFQGMVSNAKLQIPLPIDFFDT